VPKRLDRSIELEWTFQLYDINRDGIITADELYQIVSSVYDIIGNFTEPTRVTTEHQ